MTKHTTPIEEAREEFKAMGWSNTAAGELAEIHVALRAAEVSKSDPAGIEFQSTGCDPDVTFA